MKQCLFDPDNGSMSQNDDDDDEYRCPPASSRLCRRAGGRMENCMNQEELRVHGEVRRRISRIGFGIAGFFAVTYAAQFAVLFFCSVFSLPVTESITGTWLLSMGTMYLFGFPAFLLIVTPLSGKRPFASERVRPVTFLVYFLISFAAVYIFNYFSSLLTTITNAIFGTSSSSTATDLIEKSPLILVVIFAVVIGPFVEEFMFRRVLIDRLLPFGEKFSILISAVAFGLFHGNFVQFFYAAALGSIFAYLYCKTGKLRYPYLLHMSINFCGSVIPLLLSRRLGLHDLPDLGVLTPEELAALAPRLFALILYFGTVFVLVLAGVLLFALRIRRIKFSAPMVEIPKEGRAKLLLSPGVLLAFLSFLGMFILSFF